MTNYVMFSSPSILKWIIQEKHSCIIYVFIYSIANTVLYTFGQIIMGEVRLKLYRIITQMENPISHCVINTIKTNDRNIKWDDNLSLCGRQISKNLNKNICLILNLRHSKAVVEFLYTITKAFSTKILCKHPLPMNLMGIKNINRQVLI